ncbi:MAG: hypothetical protein JWO69_1563 [Thermoleophilia bacterium]|nr:hypothetical protein [Thermoleophilia bacterium]
MKLPVFIRTTTAQQALTNIDSAVNRISEVTDEITNLLRPSLNDADVLEGARTLGMMYGSRFDGALALLRNAHDWTQSVTDAAAAANALKTALRYTDVMQKAAEKLSRVTSAAEARSGLLAIEEKGAAARVRAWDAFYAISRRDDA